MKERVLSLALCGLCLLSGCQAGEAVQEEIWELEEEDAAVFADGQAADRWRGYQDGWREPWVLYQLADGTVLLQEDDIAGPEGSAAYAPAAPAGEYDDVPKTGESFLPYLLLLTAGVCFGSAYLLSRREKSMI